MAKTPKNPIHEAILKFAKETGCEGTLQTVLDMLITDHIPSISVDKAEKMYDDFIVCTCLHEILNLKKDVAKLMKMIKAD